MIDLSGLATIGLAFFVAAASPGPATIAASTISMSAGRINGLRFALGLSAGLAFWGLIAATGVGAALQASAWALSGLKLLGGAYLLWLAYQSAHSARRTSVQEPRMQIGKRRWFARGLMLNLSNPKAVIAWMATLSLGVTGTDSAWQVVAATVLCAALGFLIYLTYVLVFSTPAAMDVYVRARRWIDGVAAGLFAIVGLGLLRSAFAKQT